MAEALISRRGGGGGGLNFQVVGGTTAPSNPKENTIWVNTDQKITSHVFSATQPTGSAGMVWITIGTSSTVAFNALKKNGIQVYPISAKQYVSGAWVDKTAKSYQGSEWVDWITYYFQANGEYTGTWAEYAYQPSGQTGNPIAPTKTINADGTLKLSMVQTSGGWGAVANTTKIDFSKYQKVKIKAHSSGEDNASASRALAVVDGLKNNYKVIAATSNIQGSGFTEYEINVSNYNGYGYLLIRLYAYNRTTTITIDSIGLE